MDEVFFNCQVEREKLTQVFLNNIHTVIVVPQRYEKSNLIQEILQETKEVMGKRIDLLLAANSLFVYRALKSVFIELMIQLLPEAKQAKQKLIDFINKLYPKLTIKLRGEELEVMTLKSPQETIIDLLVGLNAVAAKMNQRVVLCLDEFQQIGLLKEHHSLEASIRHAVEISTHVTYVFSGSNRHLLYQLFNDRNRPFYRLCELLELT